MIINNLSPHPWPARRRGHDLALAFVLYAVLAFVAIHVARQPGTIAVIWLANGVAIALIASAPARDTLVLLIAAAAGNLVANLAHGDPLWLSLAFVPPNTLEVALGSFLVRRSGHAERFAIDQRSFLRVLLAGCMVPPLLGATMGAATLHTLEFAQFDRVWVDWYIGAALGGVAALPLTLALRGESAASALRRLVAPGSLLGLLLVGISSWLALRHAPFPFVVISVVLLVLAFRLPRLTNFAAVPLLVCMLALALAFGGFEPAVPNSPYGHSLVYGAALLAVLPCLLVSVVVAKERALGQMLSAVGSRADDVILYLDMNAVCRWVNKSREVYWLVPNEQVLGRPWSDNVPSELYADIVKPMFEQARAGAQVRRLTRINYPGMGLRDVDLLLQPARDADGQQIGVLFCNTDVTEIEAARRRLQQVADELLESNHRLEQFVRVSAHDLREPLNTITQFCGLIQDGAQGRLAADEQIYFGHVRHGAERMKQMLDDVLQYVRLEDTETLQRVSVDLDVLLADTLAALDARLKSSGAQVSGGPLGRVDGHPTLLALALQNLISNGCKFVAPGRPPRVVFTATRLANELHLSVADNGIGIEPAKLASLGTPFLRLHARRRFEGTGLGLSICKRVAEHHGGRIDIQSRPGEGSCFTLVLPIP